MSNKESILYAVLQFILKNKKARYKYKYIWALSLFSQGYRHGFNDPGRIRGYQ